MNPSPKDFIKKIAAMWHSMMRLFRAQVVVGGMEISDQGVRYASWVGSQWQLFGVRLPASIMEGGVIKERADLIAALRVLHSQIRRKNDKKVLPVAVSVSSASIYSQTFQLPFIRDKELESAVKLNLQMISPTDIGQVYSGWEVVHRDEASSAIEVFSSFLSKPIMDGIVSALLEAGFLPVAAESKALSLVRMVREWGLGIDATKPYVLIYLDSSGLNFVIMRFGKMTFEYFLPWKDMGAAEGKQISMANFESSLIRSLNQVVNFYAQHWNDIPLEDSMIIAPGFEQQIESIMKANFTLATNVLKLKGGDSISARWFIPLGVGFRGRVSRRKDADLTILGISPQGEYAREVADEFFRFWRIAVPAALSFLLLFMWGSSFFLSRIKNNLELLIKGAETQMSQISEKENEAKAFNARVATIYATQQESKSKGVPMEKIADSASRSNVRLSRVSINASGETIVSGEAQTQDQVRAFKKLLDEAPALFSQVQLPLSSVKSGPEGVTFSMTLRTALAASSNTP